MSGICNYVSKEGTGALFSLPLCNGQEVDFSAFVTKSQLPVCDSVIASALPVDKVTDAVCPRTTSGSGAFVSTLQYTNQKLLVGRN